MTARPAIGLLCGSTRIPRQPTTYERISGVRSRWAMGVLLRVPAGEEPRAVTLLQAEYVGTRIAIQLPIVIREWSPEAMWLASMLVARYAIHRWPIGLHVSKVGGFRPLSHRAKTRRKRRRCEREREARA